MNKPKEVSPKYKERYEKIAPFIKILQMWADGNEIEAKSKIESNPEWRKLPENPGWNFNYNDYRVIQNSEIIFVTNQKDWNQNAITK